jgi:oligoribonuclease (3'-5' exoribonuclease)
MTNRKYPSALFWIDIETTSLPEGNDWSGVEILEVGVIVTDFDLKPYFGYKGVIGMTDAIKAALAKNPEVVQMHLKNGLLRESKESTDTLRMVESEIIGMLKSKTTQDKGEFMIAGSGVATFDFQLLKAKMPELASWLAYFPFDVGVLRRSANILSGGRDVVKKVEASFSNKSHRAIDDVKAHLQEAMEFQKLFHWIIEEQTKN